MPPIMVFSKDGQVDKDKYLNTVVNTNIGFGIQIVLNLLLFTLITIWISCYLDQDEIVCTFQSPYFKGLFHNSQLCKYVLLNVAIQQWCQK